MSLKIAFAQEDGSLSERDLSTRPLEALTPVIEELTTLTTTSETFTAHLQRVTQFLSLQTNPDAVNGQDHRQNMGDLVQQKRYTFQAVKVVDDVQTITLLNQEASLFTVLSNKLNGFVQETIAVWLATPLQEKERKLKANVETLSRVVGAWMDVFSVVKMMQTLFFHFEKGYLKNSTAHDSLEEFALGMFRHALRESKPTRSSMNITVRESYVFQFLGQIKAHRERFLSDLAQAEHSDQMEISEQTQEKKLLRLKDVNYIFRKLQYYEVFGVSESFEVSLLRETESLYTGFAASFDLNDPSTVARYVDHCEKVIYYEVETISHFVQYDALRPFVQTIQNALVKQHSLQIVETSVQKMIPDLFSTHSTTTLLFKSSLKRMYKLLMSIDCLQVLEIRLQSYAKAELEKLVEALRGESVSELELVAIFVRVLRLRCSLYAILEEQFDGNERIGKLLGTLFEEELNKGSQLTSNYSDTANLSSLSFFLCRYVHSLFMDQRLMKSCEGFHLPKVPDTPVPEAEDLFFESVSSLFKLLRDKDLFKVLYRKFLCKRLIFHLQDGYATEYSLELEKKVILLFLQECGKQYTNKLENMLNDFQKSSDLIRKYGAYTTHPRTELFNPVVLTSGSWPMSLDEDGVDVNRCILPTILSTEIGRFENFYVTTYKEGKRKLSWLHSLSSVVLRAVFDGQKKELFVSLFQGIVLLQLQHDRGCSFQKLKDSTGIVEEELRKALDRLLWIRIGNKKHPGVLVQESDRYGINLKFRHEKYYVRFHEYDVLEMKKEINPETTEKLLKDRLHQIEATLVSIMKKAKRLEISELLETAKQRLKFATTEEVMKERIEGLISRDYIERDETKESVIAYVP